MISNPFLDILLNRFSPKLDKVRELRDHSTKFLNELQTKYRKETGITSLKIKKNNIIGYYIEVPSQHREKIESIANSSSTNKSSKYHLYQTGPSASRYRTQELSDLEVKINTAMFQALHIELQLFLEISGKVCQQGESIHQVILGIITIDSFLQKRN